MSAVFILFLIGALVIMKVVWLGVIGSILVLLQYIYYSRIVKRKTKENFLLEERIKNGDALNEIVDDNADVEGILIYRYYKDSKESGVMLIYETCYCHLNTNINQIMQEYNDILLREYSKLNEAEIHFISATGERAYVSFRKRIYGKYCMAVFIISVKTPMEGKELDLKVER